MTEENKETPTKEPKMRKIITVAKRFSCKDFPYKHGDVIRYSKAAFEKNWNNEIKLFETLEDLMHNKNKDLGILDKDTFIIGDLFYVPVGKIHHFLIEVMSAQDKHRYFIQVFREHSYQWDFYIPLKRKKVLKEACISFEKLT